MATTPVNQIICGDSLETLGSLAANSVDSLITSPPYFGQRDYGSEKQIGTEREPAGYVSRLVDLFREARRVLKEEGTCWINLGDKFHKGRLLGMPWRVAIAMQDDGWILRSDIIWHKPNAMPSAVKNRPTTDHEYLFLFVKNSDYYYDADAIREPHVTFTDRSRMKGGRKHIGQRDGTPENGKNKGNSNLHNGRWDQAFHPKGRNKRTVWSIPLSKNRDAHFAVFPEPLVETCIAAGSPPGGLVMDPFCGSGTTLAVAKRMGRNYLGIDCVEKYCEMSGERVLAGE